MASARSGNGQPAAPVNRAKVSRGQGKANRGSKVKDRAKVRVKDKGRDVGRAKARDRASKPDRADKAADSAPAANRVGGRQGGAMGDRLAPMGNPAGGNGDRNSTVFGNLDTGNTRIQGQAVAPYQGPTPGDTQRDIDQGLNLLNQVRAAVQDSPEARQQLQSLIDEMRNLDPKRFPGNPALVEQMHQQLVSGVDALELQLRRQLDQTKGGTIRNPDPKKVPAGYQDSVAEYYRKLSGGK